MADNRLRINLTFDRDDPEDIELYDLLKGIRGKTKYLHRKLFSSNDTGITKSDLEEFEKRLMRKMQNMTIAVPSEPEPDIDELDEDYLRFLEP